MLREEERSGLYAEEVPGRETPGKNETYMARYKSGYRNPSRSGLESPTWKAPPTGVPREDPVKPIRNVLPPGYHLTFYSGTGTPKKHTRKSGRGPSGHFIPRTPDYNPVDFSREVASPLAAMGGVQLNLQGGFTRSDNRTGVVWNQKSVLGQSAGMCMMMEPVKKSLRKERVARPMDTEVRVIPINDYESMYASTRPSLTHVGEPLTRVR